jgi:hypothetical protein
METISRIEVAATSEDIQRRVLDTLRSDGIAVVPFSDLFADDRLWSSLEEDIRQFVDEAEAQLPEHLAGDDRKAYIVRRFYKQTKEPFSLDNQWLRLAVSGPLLDVVNAYRGLQTKLVQFDNWYTIPSAAIEKRVASQRWHRDPWEDHVVKVFVYFSDVDEEAGPFEYVRGSPTGGRYGRLWPWVDAAKSGIYPPQSELMAEVAPEDILTVAGPPGTVIFCDTSGFHRGGYAKSKPRVLSNFSYASPEAPVKRRFRIDPTSDAGGLSAAARAAID